MILIGKTPQGGKVHLGSVVRQGQSRPWVPTFCGADMLAWDEYERPPSEKAGEFCRNCFRSYAWKVMEHAMQQAPGEALMALLNLNLADAEFRRRVRILADSLLRDDQYTLTVEAPNKPARLLPRREAV